MLEPGDASSLVSFAMSGLDQVKQFDRRLECLAASRLRDLVGEERLSAVPWVWAILRDVESRRPVTYAVLFCDPGTIFKIERERPWVAGIVYSN